MDLRRYPRLMRACIVEALFCREDNRLAPTASRKAREKAEAAEHDELRQRVLRVLVETAVPEGERAPVEYTQADIDADIARIRAKAEALAARETQQEIDALAAREDDGAGSERTKWQGGGYVYDPDGVQP